MLADDLRDSLALEACYDVAVFCLAVARRLEAGAGADGLAHQLPREWAIATKALIGDEATAFEQHRDRTTLRRMVEETR